MRVLVAILLACVLVAALVFVTSASQDEGVPGAEAPRAKTAAPASSCGAASEPRATKPAATRSPVAWSADLPAAMARAKAAGRLVLVYVAPAPGG
jgi:hypothetical protein